VRVLYPPVGVQRSKGRPPRNSELTRTADVASWTHTHADFPAPQLIHLYGAARGCVLTVGDNLLITGDPRRDCHAGPPPSALRVARGRRRYWESLGRPRGS